MSFSQEISLILGKFGVYLRAAFYRLACTDTSDETSAGFQNRLSHRDTAIGRDVYIGPQSNIGKCTVGEKILMGSGVHIESGRRQHELKDPQKPIQDQSGVLKKIWVNPNQQPSPESNNGAQ